jgi:hypothetical protein
LIIVLFTTDGATLLVALGFLELLEGLKTFLVKHMSAAEYGLLLEPQVLIAYGTWFLLIEALERLLLYIPPLILT